MAPIEIIEVEGMPSEHLEDILSTYQDLFENADLEKFSRKLFSNTTLFTLLARSGTKIVGFKIGYALNEQTFYSWVGGVSEAYRNQGIASRMFTKMEQYALKKGYTTLRTKSMNRFKPMMILNLKNGFDIVGFEPDENEAVKIIFEKKLT